MLVTILLILAAIIAVVLVLASTKPNSFRVARSATINATPDRIYPLVNELKSHRSWSPFDQDPKMKRSYSGPDAGTGSTLAFDGGMSCTGHLKITDAKPMSNIMMNLVMTKPFKCDNVVEFTFEPKGNETYVTWAMSGPNSFMGKLMNVFIDCNKMCEKHFEQGLTTLKAVAEK